MTYSKTALAAMCVVMCLAGCTPSSSTTGQGDASSGRDTFEAPEIPGPGEVTRNTVLRHGVAEMYGLGEDASTSYGQILFHDFGDSLGMSLELRGLTPHGVHGMQIRQAQSCAVDNLAHVAHFAPFRTEHGPVASMDHHLGDLGNTTADDSGEATVAERALPADDIFITGIGPLQIGEGGIFDVLGQVVVVQAGPDNPDIQHPDNSGGVIACGVITERE